MREGERREGEGKGQRQAWSDHIRKAWATKRRTRRRSKRRKKKKEEEEEEDANKKTWEG